MSSNGINECEDAEMADCDGEKAVTMMDVLKEQEDFEEDANAVLGASDDKNCTFSLGYIKRQAIYACMTCCSEARDDPTKRAGVCLACSLNCHENHDLIELYTKRNFRCDCGNPKFNSHPCQFTPNKNDLNDENVYNQNFSGLYCICHRPYPDPDTTTEEEMIQCVICEDWLHSSHLDAVVPANDQYTEMICKACMDKNEFLHDYSELAVNKVTVDDKEEENVDVLNTSIELNETKCNGVNETEMLEVDKTKCNENIEQSNDNDKLKNENLDIEMNTEVKDQKATEETKAEQTDAEPQSLSEKLNVESINDTTNHEQEQQVSEKISDSESTHNIKQDDIESNNTAESETIISRESVSNQDNEMTCEEETNNKIESEEVTPANVAQNENITETEQNEEKEIAEPKPLNEPSEAIKQNEESSSVNEDKNETANESTERANMPDNRTQEQVEEDLLLADPVANVQDKKEDATTTLNPDINTNEIVEENKSEPQTMDTTEPEDSAENKGEDTSNTNDKSGSLPASKPDEAITETNESNCVTVPETVNDKKEEEKSESVSDTANVEQAKNDTELESVLDPPKNKENETESGSVPELTKEIADENYQTISDQSTDKEDKNMDTNTIESNTESQKTLAIEKNSTENNTTNNSNNDEVIDKNSVVTDVQKRKLSTETREDSEIKKPKLDGPQCIRPKGIKKIHKGATFWPSNFRLKLCTCNECISMYKDLSVLFLTDPEDTTIAYERLGKERTGGKPASQYEKGMAALSSLGHVQQINALTEYGKMRDKLLEFLKSFKERKVVVKEEDIKAFFAGMKPVREPDGVYFCR